MVLVELEVVGTRWAAVLAKAQRSGFQRGFFWIRAQRAVLNLINVRYLTTATDPVAQHPWRTRLLRQGRKDLPLSTPFSGSWAVFCIGEQ